MTGPDYPAAHSMDATWYAVDMAGHVAVFETGGDGHLPRHTGDLRGYMNLIAEQRPGHVDRLLDDDTLAGEVGLFFYNCGDSFYPADLYYRPADVYYRRVVPPRPVHVDELPPEIRDGCKRVRLPVEFARARRVQPIEFFECVYLEVDRPAGYMAADGETVRPIPGREAGFPEFVRRFREENAEVAGRYRFEGIDEGP